VFSLGVTATKTTRVKFRADKIPDALPERKENIASSPESKPLLHLRRVAVPGETVVTMKNGWESEPGQLAYRPQPGDYGSGSISERMYDKLQFVLGELTS
jgi:hypothetical protein